MSSARITIGGLDVSPYAGELVVGAQPGSESQRAAGVERTYDGNHVPVVLTVDSASRARCPLLSGPWRIISALVLLALLLSLVAALRGRRRCCNA